MINSVGQALSAALEAAKLRETGQARPAAKASSLPATPSAETEELAANPSARMAAQGAPIDIERVARVKQAIAAGNYPVDPEKIAEKMLDLDLPIARH